MQPNELSWPAWRKVLFRFCFIYIILFITPWSWFYPIPGLNFLIDLYYQMIDFLVFFFNDHLFHIRKILVMPNGSGDTSYSWALLSFVLLIACIGTVLWSIVDRKRPGYRELNYWLCLLTRYFIAMTAFAYGILKIFALQMPFPGLSEMATPLGDLLPMRLSWMFIGYSQPYQIFSGVMECVVGLLLLFRRTATLGAIVSVAVFSNVMMLNLSYDIGVKLFSIHLVLLSLFLLANEWDRIVCFFILHKPAAACTIYHFSYSRRWIKITRVILKLAFIYIAVINPLYTDWQNFRTVRREAKAPFDEGVYNVAVFAVNKDTLPDLKEDTLRWREMIFERSGRGSLQTSDTSFSHRYRRAYFGFRIDTSKQIIYLDRFHFPRTTEPFFSMHYSTTDANTITLKGKRYNDSLYVQLKRSDRQFQLAERQFHWVSEATK